MMKQLTLTVEEIYERVVNEEVTEWLAQKAHEIAEAEIKSALSDSE